MKGATRKFHGQAVDVMAMASEQLYCNAALHHSNVLGVIRTGSLCTASFS